MTPALNILSENSAFRSSSGHKEGRNRNILRDQAAGEVPTTDLYKAEYEVRGLRRPQDKLLQEVPSEIPWMVYWESTPGGVSAGLQTQGAGSSFTQLLCFGLFNGQRVQV